MHTSTYFYPNCTYWGQSFQVITVKSTACSAGALRQHCSSPAICQTWSSCTCTYSKQLWNVNTNLTVWQVVRRSNIYATLLYQERYTSLQSWAVCILQCYGWSRHRCRGCALNKYVSSHAEFSWSSCCFHWWHWSNYSFKAQMPELKCSLYKLVSKRGISIADCELLFLWSSHS